MSNDCGICGSTDTGSGSWSGAWCNDCGAKEVIDEWQSSDEQPVVKDKRGACDSRQSGNDEVACRWCKGKGTYIHSEGYSVPCHYC